MNEKISPFEKFDKEWALVTAGTKDKFNTMTISWGSMGTLWFKPIITIYIRPDRYTFDFLESNDTFTVSFFSEDKRNILGMLGRTSGRDIDKVKESGLTPQYLDNGITWKEANKTYVCRKLYMDQMDKDKFPDLALKCYREGDPAHYIIIGEVIEEK